MRQYWIFTLLAAGCLVSATATTEAAVLHAIIAANTNCNIGEGAKVDVKLVREELGRISQYTGLQVREALFQGNDFRPDLVLNWVKQLQVEPDDVVLYYHNGHGFRTYGMTTRWPALDFDSRPALDLDDIANILMQKNHRFTLVLADTCNNFVPRWAEPDFYRTDMDNWLNWWQSDSMQRENYRRLFLEYRGIVIGAASKPGQYAWIHMWWGGYFTTSVLNTLKDITKETAYADWHMLMERAKTSTQERVEMWCDEGQDPIYQVDVQHIGEPVADAWNSPYLWLRLWQNVYTATSQVKSWD